MAIFDFTVPIYGFDQWSASAATNSTVRYQNGRTFSLNSDAQLTVIDVEDDDGNAAGSPDNLFSDGFIDTPGDGSPSNTSNNDQVLTQAVTIDGATYAVGSQVELEFAFTTTTGETFWVIRIDGTNVGISGPTLPTPGTTYEVGGSGDAIATPIPNVPCFTDGAMVDTPQGPVAVENLRAGDQVLTVDNGPQPILWAGKKKPSALEFCFFPQLAPVTIKRGALGPDMPRTDLTVSSLHRVLIRSYQTQYLFGEEEVLADAASLVNGTSIIFTPGRPQVTYRHLLLENHELLLVNGIQTESLYPGTTHLSNEALMDMELTGVTRDAAAGFTRPTLKPREARLLA